MTETVGGHLSSGGGGAEAHNVAAGRLNRRPQNREPQTLATGEPERERSRAGGDRDSDGQ